MIEPRKFCGESDSETKNILWRAFNFSAEKLSNFLTSIEKKAYKLNIVVGVLKD